MTDDEIKLADALTPPPEDFKDKYIRALADMENMRKRMQRDAQETIRFGVEKIIAEFLPAIDSFEAALSFANAASSEVQNWAVGFKMILAQFKDVLQANEVVSFRSEGELFNPIYHEAVETTETSDVPEGTILKEFSKGYKTHERIIRPARVSVAKRPADKNQTPTEEKPHVE